MNQKINTSNKNLPGYLAVIRLSQEYPDWLPVVKICLEKAKTIKGDFAGSWILSEFKQRGLSYQGNKDWFPNLRTLVSCGILQKTHTSRAGRRAYYLIPDVEGVEKALNELKEMSEI